MPRAYIGLGSNVGDREAMLDQATAMIAIRDSLNVLRRAGLYETEPVGIENQDWFLNTVLEVETNLTPDALLKHTQAIEKRLGRQRRVQSGPREIDLDILLYENQLIETAQLKIPHPELHRRRFVLVPLCEIAPQLTHPVLKQPMHSLLNDLHDAKQVKLLAKKF